MLRLDMDESPKLTKNGVIFAVLLGLSFSNHMSTIFLAGGCVVLFFLHLGWKRQPLYVLPGSRFHFLRRFFLSLSPHTSKHGSVDGLGHPTTLGAFFRHLKGGQYGVFMFEGSAGDQWNISGSVRQRNFMH